MKGILKKRGLLIVAAAVVVALISLVAINVTGGHTDGFSGPIKVVTQPFESVMTAMVRSLERVYGYIYEYDRVVNENAELREKVARLEKEYREYSEISQENERLRALLGLSQRSEYQYETAAVISWSASTWSSSFTIGKGTSSGLKLGDCVVTETGYVVGKITEITAANATVTTILDSSSSVSAAIYKTGATAVAQGDFELMRQGLLALRYLSDETDFVRGDTIVTSGKGGVYPRGLVIGYVEDVTYSASGIDLQASVRPAAEMEDLLYVFVITGFDAAD